MHSPRIEKIEVIKEGVVRRSRLFYLRPLRGKAARIRSRYETTKKAREVSDTVSEAETLAGNGTEEAVKEEELNKSKDGDQIKEDSKDGDKEGVSLEQPTQQPPR